PDPRRSGAAKPRPAPRGLWPDEVAGDASSISGPAAAEGLGPTTALLVVEVADASLPQDRITKAAIYAGAGIPEYWIVNLRDDQVEAYRGPDPQARRYAEQRRAVRGETLELVAFPGVHIAVDELLPRRAR